MDAFMATIELKTTVKFFVRNVSVLVKHVQMVFRVLHVLRNLLDLSVNLIVLHVMVDFAVLPQENAPIYVLPMSTSRWTIPDKDVLNVPGIVPVVSRRTGVHRVLMVILVTFARRNAYLPADRVLMGTVVIRVL